jgi:hypothetical protein
VGWSGPAPPGGPAEGRSHFAPKFAASRLEQVEGTQTPKITPHTKTAGEQWANRQQLMSKKTAEKRAGSRMTTHPSRCQLSAFCLSGSSPPGLIWPRQIPCQPTSPLLYITSSLRLSSCSTSPFSSTSTNPPSSSPAAPDLTSAN